MSLLRSQARNPLGGESPSMTEVDQAIFGAPGGSLDQLDSGRVVARPTPISTIWADVKQPRRAIPLSIRMHWDGNPGDVPKLLDQWLKVAQDGAGVAFNVAALLNGEGEGFDTDNFPSISQEFLALVRLAQGIKADGLINPITVIESDGKLLIESGERRWLAYHLLNMYLGETWARIAAAKGNTNDSVWRQATENTARRALNPIGMARQIALLIMAARGTPPMASGTQYLEYEDIVKNGTCDRRYYAQVADGNIHRIPKGMGERIQGAMDLSMEQLSRYRSLLRLTDDELVNDALWTRADVENWPERAMREISTLPMGKVSAVLQRSQWTLDDLMALKEAPISNPYPTTATRFAPATPQPPATTEWMNKTILTKAGFYGVVRSENGDLVMAEMEPDGKRAQFHKRDLTIVSSDHQHRPAVTPAPQPQQRAGTNADPFSHVFAIGDKVRTRTGSVGEVVGISGRLVTVKTVNGSMVHDWSGLVKIQSMQPSPLAPSVPQLREEDIEEDVDPEPTPHVREWSEGISIGGNNQMDTDKADSEGQAEAKPIFSAAIHREFLMTAATLAMAYNDGMNAALMIDISKITDQQAIALGAEEKLKPMLDSIYDAVVAYLADILQQVMDAAVN